MTTLLLPSAENVGHTGRALTVGFAQGAWDVREAQRLRYQVFAEEFGARFPEPHKGVDEDAFDPLCDHLIVRDQQSNEVVGTYRILSPSNAKRMGRCYADSEFDLSRLAHLLPQLVEIGRSCVHPAYRSGATIALLWGGLARYMRSTGHEFIFGCASIGMADGGHAAASLFRRLENNLGPSEYRVFPHCPLPLDALRSDLESDPPPLIKGYLRAGATICGAPAWDPDFNTADLPIMMRMSTMSARYARHFNKGMSGVGGGA